LLKGLGDREHCVGLYRQVVNANGLTVDYGPAEHGATIEWEILGGLRERSVVGHEPKDMTVDAPDRGVSRPAHPRRTLGHGI
jgi:hypothetical protein